MTVNKVKKRSKETFSTGKKEEMIDRRNKTENDYSPKTGALNLIAYTAIVFIIVSFMFGFEIRRESA